MPVTIYGSGPVTGVTSITGTGMDLITPTSVAGSGVTLSGGQVSFSAATIVSVNGCFSSNYENYKIVFKILPSTNNELDMRLRVGGIDAITNYITQYVYAAGTTIATAPLGVSTYMQIAYLGSFNNNLTDLSISGPALASSTSAIALTSYANSASTVRHENWYGVHSTATAYDGATFFTNTGTMTGTLRIYGLRNS